MGSASVMVINGEKLVIANIGNYRVVVCRDGMAHHKTDTYQQSAKRYWSRNILRSFFLYVLIRILSLKNK